MIDCAYIFKKEIKAIREDTLKVTKCICKKTNSTEILPFILGSEPANSQQEKLSSRGNTERVTKV